MERIGDSNCSRLNPFSLGLSNKVMEHIDTPIRNDLKDLPARLERTVTELEKGSKSLTKDDTKASKDEAAYLKSLISKFA